MKIRYYHQNASKRSSSFVEWMRHVDRCLIDLCSMTHDDLEDWSYRDAYDNGRTAGQAAKSAYNAAKRASGF